MCPGPKARLCPSLSLDFPNWKVANSPSAPGTIGRRPLAGFLDRALAKSPLIAPALSQQPVPEQLRIQVSRVSMHDYDALHYDKEQLKEACERHAGLEGWGGGGAAEEPPSPLRAGQWDIAGCQQPILSSSRATGHCGGPRRQRPRALPRPHREAPAGEAEAARACPALFPPAPGSGFTQPPPFFSPGA